MAIGLEERARRIIEYINEETADLDSNQRAMVCLFVKELVTCAVQLDIIDTCRPRVAGGSSDGDDAR